MTDDDSLKAQFERLDNLADRLHGEYIYLLNRREYGESLYEEVKDHPDFNREEYLEALEGIKKAIELYRPHVELLRDGKRNAEENRRNGLG